MTVMVYPSVLVPSFPIKDEDAHYKDTDQSRREDYGDTQTPDRRRTLLLRRGGHKIRDDQPPTAYPESRQNLYTPTAVAR